MPPGTRSLLGLGLKLCPSKPRPTNNINKTIDKFKTDVRRIDYFMKNPPEERVGIHYIPGLYIPKEKSDTWPPKAGKKVE